MNRTVPNSIVALVIGGVLLMALIALLTPRAATGPLVGKPAPPVSGNAFDNTAVQLPDSENRVLLLNFWASWCGPCRMEVPDLIALQTKYKARGFTVVGLSTDDTAAAARNAETEMQMSYPVLLAPPGIQAAFGGVPAIPATFLIARDGTILWQTEGVATRETLEREIEKAL